MNLEKFILTEFDQPQLRRKIDDLVFPAKDMISGSGAPSAEPKGIIQTMNTENLKATIAAWFLEEGEKPGKGYVAGDGDCLTIDGDFDIGALAAHIAPLMVAEERKRCADAASDFLTKGRSPLGRAVSEAIMKG